MTKNAIIIVWTNLRQTWSIWKKLRRSLDSSDFIMKSSSWIHQKRTQLNFIRRVKHYKGISYHFVKAQNISVKAMKFPLPCDSQTFGNGVPFQSINLISWNEYPFNKNITLKKKTFDACWSQKYWKDTFNEREMTKMHRAAAKSIEAYFDQQRTSYNICILMVL